MAVGVSVSAALAMVAAMGAAAGNESTKATPSTATADPVLAPAPIIRIVFADNAALDTAGSAAAAAETVTAAAIDGSAPAPDAAAWAPEPPPAPVVVAAPPAAVPDAVSNAS